MANQKHERHDGDEDLKSRTRAEVSRVLQTKLSADMYSSPTVMIDHANGLAIVVLNTTIPLDVVRGFPEVV